MVKCVLKPEELEPGTAVRMLFPILRPQNGKSLAYLDSAATSQKPLPVLERITKYYAEENANVHRGAYGLSAKASALYEGVRQQVCDFINAPAAHNIIFTKGTTESINLAAYALEKWLTTGDSVLLTMIEHHSNIVPWQLLARRRGLNLVFAKINQDSTLDMADLRRKLEEFKPRIVALTHISNVFGTVFPVQDIAAEAKRYGSLIVIDAAQSVAHMPIDVRSLDIDLLAFSGHKMYGPTGVGVLYAADRALSHMEPFQGGGGMIEEVALSASSWAAPPYKFEGGTPPIAEVIALGAALEFIAGVEMRRIMAHDEALLVHAIEGLKSLAGVSVYGPGLACNQQRSIVAFNLKGVHAHDIATVADSLGVQIRAGHHCAMPAHSQLGFSATSRASLGVYSTVEDIEALLEAVRHARKLFS